MSKVRVPQHGSIFLVSLKQWVRMVGVKTKTDGVSPPAPVSFDSRGHQTNRLFV